MDDLLIIIMLYWC